LTSGIEFAKVLNRRRSDILSRLPPTAWVTAERLFGQIFGLIVFAIQAPLLGPRAFGLLAVVMVFVGFWEAVPGAAATDALISIPDIELKHYGSTTVGATIFSLFLGGAVFAFAGPLSIALGDPNTLGVMRAMSVLPVIQALSIAPSAAAQREMQFRSLTIRTIVSLIAGGMVGLILAVSGAGVWALVWQALVQRTVATVVLWIYVPTTFSMSVSRSHMTELSEFALPNMVSRLMSWASGQIPRLILGFYLGPARLGLFTLATRFNDILTQIAIGPKAMVARVDLRRFRDDVEGLRLAVAQVAQHISLITFPLSVGGAIIAPTLIDTWLDPRWHDAILPCQLLLMMSVPFVTIYVSASLLLALNLQRWEAGICTAQSLAIVAAVAVAAPFGVSAAAAAMLVLAVLTAPLVIYVMWRECGIGLRHILLPQLPPSLACLMMALAIFAEHSLLKPYLSAPISMGVEVLTGASIYIAVILLILPRSSGAWLGQISELISPIGRRV
jgi:PST family polysaccharide transporter